jgi:replicative DNA helicase
MTPPHSVQNEEAVLGAILMSPDVVLPRVLVDEGLTPAAFYVPAYQAVFAAMVSLLDRAEPVDQATVTAELERRGQRADVAWLLGPVPSAGNARAYARRVVELHELRIVLEAGQRLAAGAQAQDATEIAEAERLLATRGRQVASAVTPEALGDLVFDYLADTRLDAFELPWKVLNFGCGGGLRRSQVTALGGWTGHGKSVVTDQILSHVCRCHAGAKVHLYINEMSSQERALRNAAREADVSYGRLMLKQLEPKEHAAVKDALNRGLPFGITDCAGWTAEEIARDLRWRKWDVAAVDILHNIEFRDERDIANAMQALVAAALQSKCHLIVTVHLNETRASGEVLPAPVKRDIRGSGMVKNLAHNVLFVYREQELINDEVGYTGDGRLYWDKTRSGGGGNQRILFRGDRQRVDLRLVA